MSKPNINDPDLARAFGFKNAFEFWANYSGQSTGTLVDHAQYTLTKCGYGGTLDDKFNAFLHDMFGTTTPRTSMDCYRSLINYPVSNLTFFKNYSNLLTGTVTATQLNANLAKGSATATFTATRSASAPATYVDDNGIIRLVTTSDVGRICGGYYDATGFHAQKGLMIEGSGTNLLSYSYFNTTNFNVSGDSIKTTDTTTRYTITKSNSGSGSWSLSSGGIYQGYATYNVSNDGTVNENDLKIRTAQSFAITNSGVYTVSIFIKENKGATYTINFIDITDNTTIRGTGTITPTAGIFCRNQVSIIATANDTVRLEILIGNKGDDLVFSFDSLQIESSPYATSFIPTTTAALTRNAETLKYAIAGNRTATQESIFVKFSPMGTFANDGVARQLITNDTKDRQLRKASSAASIFFTPNVTDNSTVQASKTDSVSSGTSYVLAGTCQHSSPYVSIYFNGGSATNYTAGDWTDNAWGTYFYIGTSNAGANQLNGIVQSCAFFSDVKSSTNITSITNLLNK